MASQNNLRATQPWPEKQPGRHRWVAMIVYALTDQQASALAAASTVNLGPRVDSVIGCYDCDRPFKAVRDQPCTAEAKPVPEGPASL